MKRSLLLSSILLAAAGCAADRGELASVQHEALEARANELADKVFVSSRIFATTRWVHVQRPDGTSAWTEVPVNVKVNMKFYSSSSSTTSSNRTSPDYEVVVYQTIAETGEILTDTAASFAARKVDGGYQLLSCTSTNVCNSEGGTMNLHDGTLTVENRYEMIITTAEHPASIDFVVAQ